MEESITQITERNAVVRDWSLKTQRDKGDSLVEGGLDIKGIFTKRYGDIAHLITIRVDEQLIQAMKSMLLYLLRINNVQFGKIYVKEPKPMTFKKKLVRLTDITDEWAEKQIKKKNETICIPWSSLRELVLNHPDILKKVNLFALAIYGWSFSRKFSDILKSQYLILRKAKIRSQPYPDYLSRDIQVPEYLSKGWKGSIYRMCTAAQCLDFESFLESRVHSLFHICSWTFESHFRTTREHSIPHVFKNIRPLEAYLKKEWPKEVTEQHWVSVF
ncbi:hypothetical protein CXB51_014168 [Gossypium anomalum]|uniref:Uncharacterized protein n=1 Tax=Gossypium anomalum TaxID=47600 RepID=A0A8J6D082_9ROSI|nr:hypothetical protein CXB51_014168 [Gossypium anomalum]